MPAILDELKIVRSGLLRVGILFVAVLVLLFMVPVHGLPAVAVGIERMKRDLVPPEVQVVAFSPTDSFFAQCELAVTLALLLATPYFLWEVWKYVRPGLYAAERKAGKWLLLSTAILMTGGAAFAYTVLIPLMYRGLYGFAPPGMPVLFNVRVMVGQAVALMLVTAFFFLLPVIMIGLTKLGLVTAQFWAAYWRHAVLLTALLSAIITPDGSGVSMILLAVPICILYAGGAAGSAVLSRGSITK